MARGYAGARPICAKKAAVPVRPAAAPDAEQLLRAVRHEHGAQRERSTSGPYGCHARRYCVTLCRGELQYPPGHRLTSKDEASC